MGTEKINNQTHSHIVKPRDAAVEGGVKVLYVLGAGRSGSTILHKILSRSDRFFGVGELRSLFDPKGLGRTCGCGKKVYECETWRRALHAAYGDHWREVLPKIANANRWVRDRYAWLALMPTAGRWFNNVHASYTEQIQKLYVAVQAVTNCRVIVDSSKSVVYGTMLDSIPKLDFRAVHLIRDPRGVEYSMLKRKRRGFARFRNHNVVKGALKWSLVNLFAESLMSRSSHQSLRLRYEDFAGHPARHFEEIGEFLEEPLDMSTLLRDEEDPASPLHSVAGNANRFQTSGIRLKLDTQWRENLRWRDRALVTLISWPLMARYGYIGGTSRSYHAY